jgi:DNA-binding MarR family transcriptional regulator
MNATVDPRARRLMETVRALVRRFSIAERADISCCGVTVAQAATLEALYELDRIKLGDLSRRLGISASTLTRNLDRLKERDLVSTTTDPGDGRATRVELTTAGRRAAERVLRQEERFFEQVLEPLRPGDAERILAALEDLWRALQDATNACCPGAFDHLMGLPKPAEGRLPDNGCQRC